jgi:hypothetical protein
MPANDPIYSAMDEDIKRQLAEQRARAPRAFALRNELIKLYRSLDIIDPRSPLVLLALDVLNLVLSRGEDITAREDRSLRTTFDLPREG